MSWIRAAGLAGILGVLSVGNGQAQGSAPAASAPLTNPAPLIDAAEFYKAPEFQRARLSPSGRWLAIAAGFGGTRIGLVVFDLQAWKPHAVVARYGDADIAEFEWVGDERLVYTIADQQAGGADQRWWPGLFSVERDGTGGRQLVKVVDRAFLVSHRTVGREPLEFNHELLHVPDDASDDVIVGEWRWDGTGEFTGLIAKRLNVRSGRAVSLSYGAPLYVQQFIFDSKGEPRIAITRREGRQAIHWRGPGDTAWRVLSEHPAQRAPFRPRFVAPDGSLFVSVSRGDAGEHVLTRFDFASGKPAAEPLVLTPGFDFSGSIVSETAGSRALGVRVVTDAETTAWFDPAMTAFQNKTEARLPGTINRVDCRRCGQPDMSAIVSAWSDRDPGQLWFYSAASDQWRKVGDRRAGIDPRRMGLTEFERIRARDGLQLPLWITRPADASGPRPAVVLVHGGPWVRGRSWQWNADAQFLASRGWVVIEPEFRGSTGYGQALYRAGFRQWGQAMQDDVADALAWAVDKKIADPKRVCIAGASYGGYATLMGLIRHPDLYRCGAAWVAVTDPRLMFKWRHDYDVITEYREHSYPELVGDPVADAAMLASVAPVEHAQRIKAPLLLAFGGGDRRVPLVHGERMRSALTAAGRPPEWLLYPDEGHGWFKVENRIAFARRLEDFLSRHLK